MTIRNVQLPDLGLFARVEGLVGEERAPRELDRIREALRTRSVPGA